MIINIATGPWLPVPAVQGGAIPRLWQGLAEEFAARGHEVRILCRSYPGQPQTEVINGVQYIRRGGLPQSTNIILDLLKDLFYGLLTFPTLPPADILVINDFWLPIFAALRPKAGKVVINANRFPKGQYWLYARTTFFAAASRAIQEAIAKEYPAAIHRMGIIPNPIDTRIFSPNTQPKLEPKEKVILYVGRIHPEKGVHLLLDAFSILSQQIYTVKLRIVGPVKENQGGGGEAYLRTLRSQAEGLNVEFIEPIFDVYKLAQAYREADVFCYPSLAEKGESFGVAPLEAMASGLIPVVSDLACFRDFVEDGQTGYFFDHRNHNAAEILAKTLQSAIVNWQKTTQMSSNAIQKSIAYSYKNIAKDYLYNFDKLIDLKHD
ncbi:MAG: glycosyltransferase family 4 protein [Mojavia pulchra JT2-VF2]|jgi:glycosyltransferase involved in cell wall biosynthesis|uniref:Glycosyltransferase family 4 protein n=1 Tax=Mojavia pulchra JT2-VF2 TaxID=287848 RepID=A0A951UFK0_9NOST|nr:glycosyltransferase family 4 protein [Mojavia pulchra JT2-VF2]